MMTEKPHLNSTRAGGLARVPHKQFASAVARRIIVLCYHFRRVANNKQEFEHLPDGDRGNFDTLVAMHVDGQGKPLRRALKAEISLGSQGSSDDGLSFAAAMGLDGGTVENSSFLSAVGLQRHREEPPSTKSARTSGNDDVSLQARARTSGNDDVSLQARQATESVVAHTKNALKAEIMKKLSAAKKRTMCEMAQSKAFGHVKRHICTHKSYITMLSQTTQKYHLLAESTHPKHDAVVRQLWDRVLTAKKTANKKTVITWRSDIQNEFEKKAKSASSAKVQGETEKGDEGGKDDEEEEEEDEEEESEDMDQKVGTDDDE